jgi:hypothetical protein
MFEIARQFSSLLSSPGGFVQKVQRRRIMSAAPVSLPYRVGMLILVSTLIQYSSISSAITVISFFSSDQSSFSTDQSSSSTDRSSFSTDQSSFSTDQSSFSTDQSSSSTDQSSLSTDRSPILIRSTRQTVNINLTSDAGTEVSNRSYSWL